MTSVTTIHPCMWKDWSAMSVIAVAPILSIRIRFDAISFGLRTQSGRPKDCSRVVRSVRFASILALRNRKLRSEEHTSELQSLMRISYAVFCLKKKKKIKTKNTVLLDHLVNKQ